MTNPMKTVAAALTLCTVTLGAAPAGAGGAEPRDPIKEMECLVGTWKGTGRLTMGATAADVKVTWACKRTSARSGVLCQLKMTGVPGLPSYDETDLFGWEPGTNTYHWFSVTNAGETHDHVAAAPADDAIKFVHSGKSEGKSFREVIDMTFKENSKAFALRAETFLDGKSTSVLALDARK